jgi:hypothetical protein
MASEKPIRRVVFREAVNTPGDGVIVKRADNSNEQRVVGSSTERVFPTRGAIGSKLTYKLYLQEPWIIIEHPTSRLRCRYPLSMVQEITFEEDIPKSSGAGA